jgi:hypothetical protein
MAASFSSGWTGLMKAGFSLRLEVFFLVFGMEADYRFRRKRAISNLSKEKNIAGRLSLELQRTTVSFLLSENER